MPLRGSPNSRIDVRWDNRGHFLCELLRRVFAELYTRIKRLTDEFPDIATYGMAYRLRRDRVAPPCRSRVPVGPENVIRALNSCT